MTVNEQERVLIYRRIVDESQNKNSGIYLLKNCSDEQLLEIINSAVLPNSISLDALKTTYLFNMLYSSKKNKTIINKSLSNIEELINTMQNTEKSLLKFGLFNGFRVFNWRFQMGRYVKISTDPSIGELQANKQISTYIFERIFPFAYSIISRGEKNERFPRF
jgi:hypothetical protein